MRIDPPGCCPFEAREYRDKFEDAICFETSSNNISTVVYPTEFPSQCPLFIILCLGAESAGTGSEIIGEDGKYKKEVGSVSVGDHDYIQNIV